MPKQTKSYRISNLTISQLEELAELWGTSLTETLTLIIDRAHKDKARPVPLGEAQKKTYFVKAS